MGSSDNPSQGLDAGLTEATLGPPPSMGWPGCLGQPVEDAGLARPVTGEGSPAGLVWRCQPTPCPRTSCSPGQHQEPPTGAGGPYPPPRPSMGPGRCWPACVRCCNRPSGPHRGRGGGLGLRAPRALEPGAVLGCDSRPWTQNRPAGNKAPTRSWGPAARQGRPGPQRCPGPQAGPRLVRPQAPRGPALSSQAVRVGRAGTDAVSGWPEGSRLCGHRLTLWCPLASTSAGTAQPSGCHWPQRCSPNQSTRQHQVPQTLLVHGSHTPSLGPRKLSVRRL